MVYNEYARDALTSGHMTNARGGALMTDIISGIYEIRNTKNGHCYIGSSIDIKRRWIEHTRFLDRNNHHSCYLQFAWQKYGKESFSFLVIEPCECNSLIAREQFYIDTLHPEYNIVQNAGSTLGRKFTDETKRKMSEIAKGRVMSEEHKHKISLALKGRIVSELSIAKTVARNRLGQSEETKRKISESHKGKHLSDEHKRKLSIAGKGRVFSEEHRHRIGQAQIGNKRGLGHHPTDEARKKMSDAMKISCAIRHLQAVV
jgi:group I intron endonuclease